MSETAIGDMLEEYRQLDTSHVSDALDKIHIPGQCLGLAPLDRSFRLLGRAFTIRYVPTGVSGGSVGDYIDDLGPADVAVIDNAGRLDVTVWGDLLTATASRNGVAGTVIDGVCRDSDRILQLGYPIYSRGSWMRTGKDRVQVDGYQLPVSVGGVRVESGDLLLGDGDGVVAVPWTRAQEVLDVANTIRSAEEAILDAVDSGRRLIDARIENGYHHLQTGVPAPRAGDR